MGGRRCIAGVLSAMLLSCAAGLWGQGGGDAGQMAALGHGPLVVWYVSVSARAPQTGIEAVAALHHATPLNYSEKTTGGFGQNASTYGQNAGSYGVDADSRTISTPTIPAGQDATSVKPNGIGYKSEEASNVGQNASTYGTNAGSAGKEGSAVGQNAGGYGQTAGSYGTEASNVGQESSNFGAGKSAGGQAGSASAAQQSLSSPAAEQVRETLRQAFPDLQMKFIAVDPEQLKARLMAARGTADYPDALIGTLPAAWWGGMDNEFGLAMLRPAVFYPNGVMDNPEGSEEVAILAHAPHMEAAREFALWMSEPAGCPGCVQAGLTGTDGAAAAVAKSAVERLVSGKPLGVEADPEIAAESSQGVRLMLATMGSKVAGNEGAHVQVERASVNGGLAAVALRVVVSTSGVYGVAHPLVVLREAKGGQWKVLQVSLNLPQYEQADERQALMVSDPPTADEERAGVKGVSLAAPMDGQAVSQMPQLVWDNHGGAGLQVVEWQRGEANGWSEARLYLVKDQNATLRTQVMAQFADANGRYRWRVWSVGAQGVVKISPWRTFRLVG